jgi:hypothetical protein
MKSASPRRLVYRKHRRHFRDHHQRQAIIPAGLDQALPRWPLMLNLVKDDASKKSQEGSRLLATTRVDGKLAG